MGPQFTFLSHESQIWDCVTASLREVVKMSYKTVYTVFNALVIRCFESFHKFCLIFKYFMLGLGGDQKWVDWTKRKVARWVVWWL